MSREWNDLERQPTQVGEIMRVAAMSKTAAVMCFAALALAHKLCCAAFGRDWH
jgi:hypothetical protein